jgi:Ca2+-transporting ATPase
VPPEAAPALLPWHACDAGRVAAALGTDVATGLDDDEAAARRRRDGPNRIAAGGGPSVLRMVAAQFESVVVWVLAAAALVSFVLGERLDGAAILAILVVNAVIGFLQEYQAERAIAALARLTAPHAQVLRGGRALDVPATDVVRGDVLLLTAGDRVAADARLVESVALRAAEAALTGESESVEKSAEPCAPETPLPERRSMVYLGTGIVAGCARALVTGVGMDTELGRVASLLAETGQGQTPLQARLDVVARRLLWGCLVIVAVMLGLGLLRGRPPLELFMTAVSLAVAAIPEGLPAIVTVALALGVQRMARRHTLVRKLPAVETLGSTTVICTDKTGTLTVGAMTARRVVTWDRVYPVTGEGYARAGAIRDSAIMNGDAARTAADDAALAALLYAGVACNDARLNGDDPSGDPTEVALLVLAAKGGVDPTPPAREAVVPFDPARKRMTVVTRRGGALHAAVKGAPEEIIVRCTRVRTATGVVPLDPSDAARLLDAAAVLAGEALRVLAVAEREVPDGMPCDERLESDLVLLGLVGLQDPPRPEARDAVAACHGAGIRVVMITGDHPRTAHAIARELGILHQGDVVLDGTTLASMDDATLAARVTEAAVYARVTAEDKLRIVRAWQARGAVVAMTGDGVNDAPAVRAADIGIAMGGTGTEVTKEAADMIVTDDDFASIVAAVEEGRGIYDNIAKTLRYLAAGNAAELLVMLVAAIAGWPLPLLPIHLLWINLVTDGLPALALATDLVDPGLLRRPPRPREAQLADAAFLRTTAATGLLAATATLIAYGVELASGGSVAEARDAAFTVLVFEELLRSFAARSTTRSAFRVGLLSNLRLLATVVVGLLIQVALHEVPVLAAVFDLGPVPAHHYAGWFALALIPAAALELQKLLRRGTTVAS